MRNMSAVAAGLALLASSGTFADYPDRPIKLVVPWAAGGDTDNIFRPFAPLLQKHIGQTVVIANVGGASGTKGAKEVKDSPADGYTLFAVHDYIHSTYYAGVADIAYTDFEPVCLIASTSLRKLATSSSSCSIRSTPTPPPRACETACAAAMASTSISPDSRCAKRASFWPGSRSSFATSGPS